MKKLVCLMIVALIGTVASATLIEKGLVDIDYTINGDVATISFVADAGLDVTSFSFGSLTDNGAGGMFAYDAGSGLAEATWNSAFTNAKEAYRGDAFGMGDAGTLVLGAGAVGPGSYAQGTLVTFTYSIASLPTTFNLLDDPANGYVAQITYLDGGSSTAAPLMESFTIVPEPMTVALLGLGGLFIRRRK